MVDAHHAFPGQSFEGGKGQVAEQQSTWLTQQTGLGSLLTLTVIEQISCAAGIGSRFASSASHLLSTSLETLLLWLYTCPYMERYTEFQDLFSSMQGRLRPVLFVQYILF